jgi:hypothetical protein
VYGFQTAALLAPVLGQLNGERWRVFGDVIKD